MNAQELEAGDTMVVDFDSAKDGEIIINGHVSSKKVFRFDSVFTPEECQGRNEILYILDHYES
jgi:kinesin family member C2/C3